ncbi:MAG: hypothetical protein KGH71_05320 [Candidatus Micrarchaeota archaeon]|nr:hypothetical protein [Candidatus Micrarchaeota archaeon]
MQVTKNSKEPVLIFIRRDAADKLRELARNGDIHIGGNRNISWDNPDTLKRELERIKEWIQNNSKDGIAPSHKEFFEAHGPMRGALQEGKFPEIGRKYSDLIKYFGLKGITVNWSDEKTKSEKLTEAIKWIKDNSNDCIAPSINEFSDACGPFLGALQSNKFPEIGKKYLDFVKYLGLKSKNHEKINWEDQKIRTEKLEQAINWIKDNSNNGIAPSMTDFKKVFGAFVSALREGKIPNIGNNYLDLIEHIGLKSYTYNVVDWADKNTRNSMIIKATKWIQNNSKDGIAPSIKEFEKLHGAFCQALISGKIPEIGTRYSDFINHMGLKIQSYYRIDWLDEKAKNENFVMALEWLKEKSKDGIAPSIDEFRSSFNNFLLALRNGKFPKVGTKYSDFVHYAGLKTKTLNWENDKTKTEKLNKAVKWINKHSKEGSAPSVHEFKKIHGPLLSALRSNKLPEVGTKYSNFVQYAGLISKRNKPN